MATFPHLLLILLATISYLFYFITRPGKKPSPPTNWPLVGMIPAVIMHINHAHDYITAVLAQTGGSFQFKGPWFCNLDMLITCDPSIINHVFTKNFPNYPKGPEFRKIFEILGDGIVNSDHHLWELHRKITLHLFTRPEFYPSLEKIIWDKVETGLLPLLDSFSDHNTDFDAQEIFQRFAFDNICKIVFGDDPQSLKLPLPHVPCERAFSLMSDPLMHRHVIPETIYRLQKRFGVGKERVLNEANRAFDEFIYPRIERFLSNESSDECKFLKAFVDVYGDKNSTRIFLRDTALNLMLAGRDTTSTCLTWFFWLLAANPSTETKILEEISKELDMKKSRFFSIEESRKLTYLHGALCESLRLFPPVALEHKSPVQTDYLPTGVSLKPRSKIIFSFYSVGRMESVWGKDCLEFKPERWITSGGGIKHEPSYKFPVFNVGPRTCLGKEMAFIQMKMVAVTILYRFKVVLVEGHPVFPKDSIILTARDGLRVRLSKRIA